jgi:hypothetical protein
MPAAALLALALLAAPAAAQQAPSPFIVDQDALDRRYGLGGEGDRQVLPPSEGAEPGGAPWAGGDDTSTRSRGQPRSVGSDVVDQRGVVQPGQRPFIRF